MVKKAATKPQPIPEKKLEPEKTAAVVAQPKPQVVPFAGRAMTREQIDLVKRQIAKGASDDELALFIEVAKQHNLNPFKREIYLVKRFDTKTNTQIATPQVGIDGFRLKAERSGAYAGNDDPVFSGEQKSSNGRTYPASASVIVRKIVQGKVFEFTASARWSEYFPGEKMGFMWTMKPYLMLGKCAEALALRKAFPGELNGLYIDEEMEQAGQSVEVEVYGQPEEKKAADDEVLKQVEIAISKAKTAKVLREIVDEAERSDRSDDFKAKVVEMAMKYTCSEAGCGELLTKLEADYSQKVHKKILCRQHQTPKSSQPQPSTEAGS